MAPPRRVVSNPRRTVTTRRRAADPEPTVSQTTNCDVAETTSSQRSTNRINNVEQLLQDRQGPIPSTSNFESSEPTLMELRHSLAALQQQLLDHATRTNQLEQENRELRNNPALHTTSPGLVSHESSLMNYDGKTSWEEYVGHLEVITLANGWTETRKGQRLASALRGAAMSVMNMLPIEKRVDYSSLASALGLRFGQSHLALRWQRELETRRQRPGESLIDLATDIERLVRQSMPDWPEKYRNPLGLQAFLRALSDRDMSKFVAGTSPTTIQEALTRAQLIESQSEVSGGSKRPDQSLASGGGRRPDCCWKCGADGHFRDKCPQNRNAGVKNIEPEN